MLVEVEALEHGGVGPLELPLLAGGAGVARVHEHALLGRAAVHAAVTDGVVQTLILHGETADVELGSKTSPATWVAFFMVYELPTTFSGHSK